MLVAERRTVRWVNKPETVVAGVVVAGVCRRDPVRQLMGRQAIRVRRHAELFEGHVDGCCDALVQGLSDSLLRARD